MNTTTADPREVLYVAIWAPAGEWAIDYRRAPYYADSGCFSCQRVAAGDARYSFCGHVWDSVWKSDAATVAVTDGRVWIEGHFEGRPDLARDLAATLTAAAEAADIDIARRDR